MLMRTTIGPDDAATVGELLREIGQGRTTPEELRDASAHRRVPIAERDRARYWAAYLEGRMAS
jgi:hypothetical protein